MCVSTVFEERPEPEGVGWKVFVVSPRGDLTSEFVDVVTKREVGKWLRATDVGFWRKTFPFLEGWFPARGKTIWADDMRGYAAGWHVFTDQEDARMWLGNESDLEIRKVRYRGAHTEGRQFRYSVIVAEEIFILPNGPDAP